MDVEEGDYHIGIFVVSFKVAIWDGALDDNHGCRAAVDVSVVKKDHSTNKVSWTLLFADDGDINTEKDKEDNCLIY